MMTAGYKLIAVIGATATGKSAAALALAEKIGGEILSVDSMQVYRGMDIGTAKPTADEQRAVKHHLIDVADSTETFTVARFVELADAVIADAKARNVPLIATGGTPMYFKALFEGLFEGPTADAELRDRLRAADAGELHARLTAVDPAAAARIHRNDQRRLVRALEVYELTGKPISEHQSQWGDARHAATWFGLEWEKEALNRRINARAKLMIAAGWMDEVKALLAAHGSLSQTAAEATGYAELLAHAEGRLSLDEATEQIKMATRQLARRQLKWLRRFPNVTWFAGDQSAVQIAKQMVKA